MGIASIVFFCLALLGVLTGLIPCLGWMNWINLPICVVTAILGVAGVLVDKDPVTRVKRNLIPHVLALAGGPILGTIALIRLILGGGLF